MILYGVQSIAGAKYWALWVTTYYLLIYILSRPNISLVCLHDRYLCAYT